jgi:hypothetical protein
MAGRKNAPIEKRPLHANGRLGEIAEILVMGLARLNDRMSSQKPAEFGESSLHFSPDQSGDGLSFSTGISQ